MRAAAGTFLATATMAGSVAMGSGPAAAAKTAAPVFQQDILRTVAVAPLLTQRKELTSEQEERISGVRQDLDVAVWLGQVTREQADRFAAQLEDRIIRGL
ncbi:hypothetical protein GCM10027402_01330 [Arthrobacter monumenti]